MRRRAFTLVELLVVLGIISVLVAILLPALNRAREHADRVKCATNLRSMGQALTMYTQQSGYYPGGIAGITSVWPIRLRPLLGGDTRVFLCPSQDDRYRWEAGRPPEGMPGRPPLMAADEFYQRYGYDAGELMLPAVNTYFSYGYNNLGTEAGPRLDNGLGYVYLPAGGNRVGEQRASRVKVPEDMIAVADATVDHVPAPGAYLQSSVITPEREGKSARPPARIHAGGANVLFCDGHVSWYRQDDLTYEAGMPSGQEAERQRPIRRMWNVDHEPHIP